MPTITVPAKPKFEVPLDLQAASKVIEKHRGPEPDEILSAMVKAAGSLSDASANARDAAEAILGNQMADPVANVVNARRRVREIAEGTTRRVIDTRQRIETAIGKLEAATPPKRRGVPIAARRFPKV